jgi:hypothetical protein
MSFEDEVDREVRRLRGASPADLASLSREQTAKRLAWFEANRHQVELDLSDPLAAAYALLLARLGLEPGQAPIVEKTEERLVFRSANRCPTLAACQLLGLDTGQICRAISEPSTDALLRALDPRLRFGRNYSSLRPHAGYCEEVIMLDRDTPVGD